MYENQFEFQNMTPETMETSVLEQIKKAGSIRHSDLWGMYKQWGLLGLTIEKLLQENKIVLHDLPTRPPFFTLKNDQ